MEALRISSFKGLQTLPIRVALARGFFAEQGLDVRLSHATGSASQLAALAHGECELIQTAPDNVIHFNSDPHAFASEIANESRIVMVLGGSLGPLSLWARPGSGGSDALRGAVMGVDNPTSGFALVLRDLLRRSAHLEAGEYALTLAGGTHARAQALARGEFAATVLYPPFDLAVELAGCVRLASSADHYPAYASLATTGTNAWVGTHQETVVRYIRAVLRALRRIYDPAHAEQIARMIQEGDLEGVAEQEADLARRAYAAFVAPATGFGADASLDDAGLRQVIALRNMYGEPLSAAMEQLDVHRDMRWHEQARASEAAGG